MCGGKVVGKQVTLVLLSERPKVRISHDSLNKKKSIRGDQMLNLWFEYNYLVVLILQNNDHETVKVFTTNQLVVVARSLMAMGSGRSRDSGSQCKGNGSNELDGDHDG
jgi:hypothetical protein